MDRAPLTSALSNAGVEGPVTKLANQTGLDARALSKGHLENESLAVSRSLSKCIQADPLLLCSSAQAWDQVFQINNHAVFFSTMTFLPLLSEGNKRAPSGRASRSGGAFAGAPWSSAVINITSISGVLKLSQNHYAYNSCKASANALTRMLAHEFNFQNRLNIRVNAIAPGLFITVRRKKKTADTRGVLTFAVLLQEMITGQGTGSRADPNHEANSKMYNPAGRAGTEEEMAQLCLYMAANTFQQGQVVVLDGGFTTACVAASPPAHGAFADLTAFAAWRAQCNVWRDDGRGDPRCKNVVQNRIQCPWGI